MLGNTTPAARPLWCQGHQCGFTLRRDICRRMHTMCIGCQVTAVACSTRCPSACAPWAIARTTIPSASELPGSSRATRTSRFAALHSGRGSNGTPGRALSSTPTGYRADIFGVVLLRWRLAPIFFSWTSSSMSRISGEAGCTEYPTFWLAGRARGHGALSWFSTLVARTMTPWSCKAASSTQGAFCRTPLPSQLPRMRSGPPSVRSCEIQRAA
mmetsp:Transcript_86529/g.249671  ORF Transcript_86529/g.249671 Transcript_86529/m.249671 type:complete len:213 (-) Transcript_86529:79-717(-)